MVDANDKDETPKSNLKPEADVGQSVIAPSDIISKPDMNSDETEVGVEVTDDMEEYEEEEEEDEDEEEEEEYEDEYEEDEEVEQKVNDEGLDTDKEREKEKIVVEDATNKENDVKEDEEDEDEYEEEEDEKIEEKVTDEGLDMDKEREQEQGVVEDATNKENAVQEDDKIEQKVNDEGLYTDKEREKEQGVVEDATYKENVVKENEKNNEVPKSGDKLGENSKNNGKRRRLRNRNKKKDEQKAFSTNGEKDKDEKLDTNKEDGEKIEQNVNLDKEHEKEQAVVEDATNKENTVKKEENNAEVPKIGVELGVNPKSNGKRPRPRNRNRNKKKDEQKPYAANGEKPESSNKTKVEEKAPETLVADGDKQEASRRKKGSKRVESMGMVFMCTSKTKSDCFRYKVLGLPGNKKDQVAKIYKGMRLFLFDVDLRLMYGIFKAAGPGGYNLEPKAFKADFPSQVRFTVLDDCLPLAEENFKGALKENYYSRNKFEGLLKADQVKNLCKLFLQMDRGGAHPITPPNPHIIRPIENQKKRKMRARSPQVKERRYIDYVQPPVLYQREHPILYKHEAPVQRLYTHERPEHNTYNIYSREAPSYHDPVYTLPPPKYNLVSREYHPLGVPTQEYRLSGSSTSYRNVGHPSEYRSSAVQLPGYRSQTHYRF
ncbi:uncharacterized protein [Rutidosis leptorrhynchoides]